MINRITPEEIVDLKENEILVFGSNLAGRHGMGLACYAARKFGAIYGKGIGIQGFCYAIPTKDHNIKILPLNKIKPYIDSFIEFAKLSPEKIFLVTKIGCGLAGYKVEEIAPLFKNTINIDNIWLPLEFWKILERKN